MSEDIGNNELMDQSNNNIYSSTKRRGKKKKPFIDKKNSTTFRLVHRSQRDPLIADNDIGQHVLQPISSTNIDERAKYGIYYTDDYDYLKHLKSVGETIELGEVDRTIIPVPNKTLNLPSVIFETKGVELKVGLLNQAAPSNELLPDIDPEISAALEGELINGEEGFDDDFIIKLNGDDLGENEVSSNPMTDEMGGKSELMERFGLTRESKYSSDGDESDSDDEDYEFNRRALRDSMENDLEECRSRFTNYSMSSAVIKRPDGLQIIDEHFEALYEQYDEEKCGEIEDDNEVIGGFIDQNDERFKKLIQDYSSQKRKFIPEKPSEEIKNLVLKIVENEEDIKSEEMETDEDETMMKKRRWDCESILSTNTTHRNHPQLIREVIDTKKRRNLKMELKQIDDEEMDDAESVCTRTTTTIRSKGETPEERRLRKAAVREERRERRNEKKINKNAFKEQKKEFDRQKSRIQINSRPLH